MQDAITISEGFSLTLSKRELRAVLGRSEKREKGRETRGKIGTDVRSPSVPIFTRRGESYFSLVSGANSRCAFSALTNNPQRFLVGALRDDSAGALRNDGIVRKTGQT